MDPAEAVLQEKALKFMVRRRCRPGNVRGSGVNGVAERRTGPSAHCRRGQRDPGLRPAAGATQRDGAELREEAGGCGGDPEVGAAAPPSCG